MKEIEERNYSGNLEIILKNNPISNISSPTEGDLVFYKIPLSYSILLSTGIEPNKTNLIEWVEKIKKHWPSFNYEKLIEKPTYETVIIPEEKLIILKNKHVRNKSPSLNYAFNILNKKGYEVKES